MSVARHTAYNLAGSIVPIAVTLVTVPLYLKAIGLDRYGVLALVWVLAGYFAFFDFGIGRATARKMATLVDAGPEARNRLFWTSALLTGGLAAVATMAFTPVAFLFVERMDVPAALRPELGEALPLVVAAVPIGIVQSLLSGAMDGRRAFGVTNVIGVVGNVATAILPLVTAWVFAPRLALLVAATLLSRLLVLIAQYVACQRLIPLGKPAREPVGEMLSLARFGGWVTVTGIAAAVLLHVEKLVIGWRLGAAAVSVYVIPFNLLLRFLSIPQSLSSALFPAMAGASADDAAAMARTATRVLCDLFTVIAVAGIAVLPFLFTLWLGKEMSMASSPIAIILFVGIWFNVLAYPPYSRLQSDGRPHLVAYLTVAQIPYYLPVLYVLMDGYGLLGAAAAWTIRVAAQATLLLAVARMLRGLLPKLLPGTALVGIAAALAFASDLSPVQRGIGHFVVTIVALWGACPSIGMVATKLKTLVARPEPAVQIVT